MCAESGDEPRELGSTKGAKHTNAKKNDATRRKAQKETMGGNVSLSRGFLCTT